MVVGVGDMFGDVFGNGMFLLKVIKVVVVFDYCDIFIDFDLDLVIIWKECKWLFDMGCLFWKDYNMDLIFKGGGVFFC